MGVILQVALPSRVLAAARLQCGAAGAGESRGLGVCAEHARLAARGESPRAMEIGDFVESGLLENEPTAPAEQAHTTQRQ